MKAEELFEKLGYKKQASFESICYVYENEDTADFEIIFDLKNKNIHIHGGYTDKNINMDEFKAIQQQLKELHWIHEKAEIKEARNPEVTNFEHYKDRILDCFVDYLAVVKGIPKLCSKTDCNECDFKINQIGCREKAKDWLKQPYKKPKYKFTQFEYDLINTYRNVDYRCKFNGCYQLKSLKEKGYFKGVNMDETIEDILANCEVV